MNEKAKYFIQKLQLKKHPEGGYYREIYRAAEMFYIDSVPKALERNAATSIYFLLEGKQVSKFHKLKSDEQWHFYDGSTVKIYVIDSYGKLNEYLLGADLVKGESFQIVIKKNNWFAAEVINKRGYALIGCTVAPGFDFDDFELADSKLMLEKFPHCADIIKKLT
ncbi:MAG: cupin domain-containing protein [Ignavibacteriaceae bacterium]|jgi:predicted cupin superfamily sugar epimerase|nr:cupin domain-containing protein [Ignavibacteriaceae bacterium]